MKLWKSVSWRILWIILVCGSGKADDGVVKLPPWRVEETRPRTDSPVDDGPSSVVSVRESGGRTWKGLDEALGGVPGLMILQSFGGFEPPRLSIRGSGIQSAPTSRGILVEVDGLPLNLADGSFNSALLDPGLAGRIEVYRGYEAAREGASVMGGVIDLGEGTRPVRDGASLQAGSWGYVQGQAMGGTAHANGAVSWQSQDGYRAHSRQERTVLSGSARWGATRVSVYGATLGYDVPGPLTLAAALASPRSVSVDVQRDQPHRDSTYVRAAVDTQWTRDENGAALSAGLAHVDDSFRQLQANGVSRTDGEDGSWNGALWARSGGGRLRNEIRLSTEGVAGVCGQRRYTNEVGNSGRLFGNDGLKATTASTTVENQLGWAHGPSLSLGGTWLTAERDIEDRMKEPAGAATTTLRWSDSRGLVRGRLAWSPWGRAEFYADGAQTAEPPTFDDMLVVTGTAPALSRRSVALKTQTARTWEVGARGAKGPVEWDLCLYRGNWDNEILRLADSKGLPRGAVNAGPTVHEGAETTLRWKVVEGRRRLAVETTAMWTRCTFSADPVYGDGRLAGLPPRQGRLALDYEDDGGLFASATCDWTAGRTLADHAGRLGYGGQAITGLKLGWRAGRGWTVWGQVDNLMNRRWIASTAGVLDIARAPAATALFLPGVGRSVTLGLAWRR